MVNSWKKWVTVGKMRDKQKNTYRQKNMIQVEKCVIVRKMCHSHKNVSQLEKCVTVRKVDKGQKCFSQLKMGDGKMGQSQKNGLTLLQLQKIGSQLDKWATVGKIGDSQKNA